MPEIKHNFTGGKMNKDLDERLVPNGQYRDAMNVQVSTSEGSNIGTIQNILGNSEVDGQTYLPTHPVCISSISDEKNDSLYWFVTGDNKDIILQLKNSIITPVFVDLEKNVLRFDSNNIITGINIIDNLLFWTDSISEPKKINIQQCIEGTDSSCAYHTRFINPTQGYYYHSNVPIKEEHIIVIKPFPKHPLTLQYDSYVSDINKNSGIITISTSKDSESSFIGSSQGPIYNFDLLNVGDTFKTFIDTDILHNETFDFDWKTGDEIVLKEFSTNGDSPVIPIINPRIRGIITNWSNNLFSNASPIVNQNGNFESNNGGYPSNWSSSNPVNGWSYGANPNVPGFNLEADPTYPNAETFTDLPTVVEGQVYEVTFTIGVPNDNTTLLEGRVGVYFFDDDDNFYPVSDSRANALPAGTYTDTFTVPDPSSLTGNWRVWTSGSHKNKLGLFVKLDSGKYFNGTIDNVIVRLVDETQARVEIKIVAIDDELEDINSNISISTTQYAITKFVDEDSLFKTKFSRFAYRYKYIDNEYSTFSPFSEIAFIPTSFNYHPNKGYNLGMVNSLKSLTLKDFIVNIPKDVKSIDVLYKEENSPNIYIVDTIKDLTKTKYTITSETIKNGIVPSNQLLRLWDNVPKTALAQDVVGNRIVYGNYLQNYDLIDTVKNTPYSIKMNPVVVSNNNNTGVGKKSIKSLREYQLGVVYVDHAGRETPVLTNSSSTLKLDNSRSSDINRFQVSISNEGHPINMKYFKFYIKDTSGEYYNLAMDRYFDAKDDNIWLSFPSSERNKLEIDDYLILKKGIGNTKPTSKEAKHKVLDIKNEAPDFIKRENTLLCSVFHGNDSVNDVLFNSSNLPNFNSNTFTINHGKIADNSIANLHGFILDDSNNKYYVSLYNTSKPGLSTEKYEITSLGTDVSFGSTVPPQFWYFTLDKPFSSEINEFTNSPNGTNVTQILTNTHLNIYRSSVQSSPVFDGKFFVKVHNSLTFKKDIQVNVDEENIQYTIVGSRPIFSLETQIVGPIVTGGASTDMRNPYPTIIKPISKYTVSGLTNTSAYQEAFYNIENNTTAVGLTEKVIPQNFSNAYNNYPRSWKTYNRATTNMSAIHWRMPEPVQNGILSRRWRMYDAYFRGINVNPDGIYYRKQKMDIHGDDANNQAFEDVWFIDKGESMGNYGRDISEQWHPDPGRWRINNTGLESWDNTSRIELSFGGIQPVKWMDEHNVEWWTVGDYDAPSSYIGPRDETFFDLESGNTNYSKTQGSFAKNLSAGSQFRFKQDPNGTVYTIVDVVIINRCRYDALGTEISDTMRNTPPWNLYPSHVTKLTYGRQGIAHQVMAKKGDETKTTAANPNPSFGNNITSSGGSVDRIHKTSSFLRASNYTKNFRIKLNKPIAWDPVSNPGSKIAGSNLILSAMGAGGINYVEVASLVGSGTNKNILTVGMVLENYVTPGASYILTIPAIVSKINEVTGGYRIWFKTYDGSPDWGESTDIRPDDIASTNVLNFYQYPMNGLSPNSAKNLNFFREGKGFDDTKVGTDALGYDLEFIEPLIDEEQIMPVNPAIWETEPKEQSSDLDIYYEATGVLPISLANDNFSSIIPLGSQIKLENSNLIPSGTIIKSVNGDTGEITLSNDVEITIPGLLRN